MVDSSFVSATAAYRSALRTMGIENPQAAGQTQQVAPVQEFSEVLREAVRDSIDVQRKGEQMSMKAVANEADLSEVVMAVSSAELTLETVVTIRDKVIAAYQDIIRMPI